MASKGFEFIQGNERLDWGVLVAIDVERLMSSSKSGDPISTGANIDTLQRIVENIAFSRITHDEAKLFTADHVLHLFQLAQFVIQYLVYCQDTLATMNVRLSSRTEENERRLSRLEQQRHALENDNVKLRKEVKSMRRTLIAYESTQHLLDNNWQYENKFSRRYHSNPHMPVRRAEPFCHTSQPRRRSTYTHPNGYYTMDDYDAHYDSETEYDGNGYIHGVCNTHAAQNGNKNNQYYSKGSKPMKQRKSDAHNGRQEPTMQYICQWCGDGYHKIESLQSHLRKRHASRVLDRNVTDENHVEQKINSTQPFPARVQEREKNYRDSKLSEPREPPRQYSNEQENQWREHERYKYKGDNNNNNNDDGGEQERKTRKQLERLEEELSRMKEELHKSKLMEMEKREQLLLNLLQQKSVDRLQSQANKTSTTTPSTTTTTNNNNTVTTLAEPIIPPLALPGLPSSNTYVQSQETQTQLQMNQHQHHNHHHQQEHEKESKQHEIAHTTQFVTSPERHSLVQTATPINTIRRDNNYQDKRNNPNINFGDSAETRIQSIPVMPDVEAASAYNTSRAHELTNNALMRQMLELQDEIKALKISSSDEHTHSAMSVSQTENVHVSSSALPLPTPLPLHVTLPLPQHTVAQLTQEQEQEQQQEQDQDKDREAANLAKYGPPGPSFVPPEILSRRSLSLSGSANKLIQSTPPQTATATTTTTTTTTTTKQQEKEDHHEKDEAALHHHHHREREHHTRDHNHHHKEQEWENKEKQSLERSPETNASTKVLQSSLMVPSVNVLPTPVPVLPSNAVPSVVQAEPQYKLGSNNTDDKMIAIKNINDTGIHNKMNTNKTLLSTSSSSTLSSTGTSYSSSSSSSELSSSYSTSTSTSQTSSTSLSKSTMPPSSVQTTSQSIHAPSTFTAIPVPIPTINNNFFQPTLPKESTVQQPQLLQHLEQLPQSMKEKKKEEEAKQKEHRHKHKREQEQSKISAIPIPVPINPTIIPTGMSNGNKTNISSAPTVTPSPYANASYMTGMANTHVVGDKLDQNSNLNISLPVKGNESDTRKPKTAVNTGSNKQGLLAALKIAPPQASHSSSLSSSSSSYSASSSGSSSSGSYSYSSSGSYSSSQTSTATIDKVQPFSKTTAGNANNIVVSNTYLDQNRGNQQNSSSTSYSYEPKQV